MADTKITAIPTISFESDSDTGMYYSGGTDTWKVQEIGLDPDLLEKIERIERNLEKVMDRLAVLDEPSDEQLEKFKTLKKAHDKYKFLDELCGKDES